MSPPFSAEQFFGVFVAYNSAVWPAQIGLVALALATIALAVVRPAWASRTIGAVLAFFWLWMAVAYHWFFFADINPAARAFAVVFALQAAVLFWLGVWRGALAFRPRRDLFGVAGAALIGYALVVYPLIGLAVGRTYPAQPTFGLPCPTTIFTVGMLLWAEPKVPWIALVVPAAWSLVGLSAVWAFGVVEDAMLPVAAILGGTLILLKNAGAPSSPTTAR
jgi:hypothetical protein